MSTPSSASDRPLKRLRLGTKSCAECRRRKVRCMPNETACKKYTLHEVDCIPQGGKKGNPGHQEDQDVHGKLANLVVRLICSSMELGKQTSNLSQIEINTAEVLRRMRATSEQRNEGSISRTELTVASDHGASVALNDPVDPFVDAPLLILFKDTMLIKEADIRENAI
ncbi:hypothetical protein G7Y89_g11976 [Cudoniella acicularis]|uniref:Zn(2)-C6 fungal-type domain-containing protein n=1 Tax=Cudoniella acicularis TaxID=354080 RepID=A0A8H4RCA0_9HELO|nr:hypothetical protein G7Y89_g11976 [Cudoniella acicularis]